MASKVSKILRTPPWLVKFDFRTCAKTPSDLADDGGGEVVAGQLVPRRQGRHADRGAHCFELSC